MQNYFSLFSLEPSFAIDAKALKAAYFASQQATHPDRMAGKSPEEKAAAALASTHANDAYNTLKQPVKRAQHLLALRGIAVCTNHDTVKPTPALLTEIMDMQEESIDGDALQQRISACEQRLTQHFEQQQWEDAAQETLRLHYLMRMRESTHAFTSAT